MSDKLCKWCNEPTFSRGLCTRHYQRARRNGIFSDESEPQAKAKGRPAKQSSLSWLAKLYDDLSRDLAQALVLIEQGEYEKAKVVLSGKANAKELQLGNQDKTGTRKNT